MAEADWRVSFSHGSAEEVDHFCNPCLTIGQQVDADKYCVGCGEYLCKTCSDDHFRTKTSRNHKLVDKDNVGQQPTTQNSEVCTVKCPEHKQEVISYFCPQHDNLGCHVCMIMHHKTCEVDYIPDQCKDIINSGEYRRTVQELQLKLQEVHELTKITEGRNQDVDLCYQNLLHEIITFRKEINDYLNQLQQKIQKEADKKKAGDKQIIQRILDGCSRLSLDIEKMQSTMKENETAGKYGQLYITVKQAQSVLRSDKIKADDGLEKTALQYIFKCNSSLRGMLSRQGGFGKLSLTSLLQSPRRNMKFYDNLTKKEDIKVETKSDQKKSRITGCAALSSNKLILVDNYNKKLKLMNTHTKSVVKEKSLDSHPFDIAVMSQHQMAVTMPLIRKIFIMQCGDRMSTVNTISVTGMCRGITYNQDQLHVVCRDPLCILVLDKKGDKQHKVSLNTEFFSEPCYIVVNADFKLLYISDSETNCVVSITLQGEVIAVYKQKDLGKPHGMLLLDDGSLLVSCGNGTIHHMSGDLRRGRIVTDGLRKPYPICYNHHLHEVYIGCQCHLLTVFIQK